MYVEGLMGKRLALVIASEETYPGAPLGVIHEIQEYARYTHCEFVGVVQGIGNKRGDVTRDPSDPLEQARDLGRRLGSVATPTTGSTPTGRVPPGPSPTGSSSPPPVRARPGPG